MLNDNNTWISRNQFWPGLVLVCVLMAGARVAQAMPQIESWHSASGATVMFVPTHELPMLDVRIVFDAGSARDAGASGLAMLTNGLLAEGAGGLSSQQIAEQFEAVGAEFVNASLRDMAYVGVRSLTDARYLDSALHSLQKVLTQPDFPKDAFARELARLKVAAVASEQSPAEIAERAYYAALYAKHPYATPSAGTVESLPQLTPELVRKFYQRYYVANNAVVAIVGDIERAQAETLVERLLAALPQGEKPAALPMVAPLQEAQTIRIEFPSQQSHIFVGQPGMKRGDADYFPLYVANFPFGGSGFASRLVATVREDRGLAYSVYSYFSPMREVGPFTMGMQTRSDQSDTALALLTAELDKYLKQGPSDAEMVASISNITGSFPLELDSNSKLLDYIAMIGFYDLPLDYLQNFIASVKAVSRDAAHEAMQRRIDAGKLITVIVGSGAEQ